MTRPTLRLRRDNQAEILLSGVITSHACLAMAILMPPHSVFMLVMMLLIIADTLWESAHV